MKFKSLVKAIEKTGLELKNKENYYYVEGKEYEISFYKQEERVVCLHARRHNDHSDSMSDYHAGFFPKTIKYAIETLKEGS